MDFRPRVDLLLGKGPWTAARCFGITWASELTLLSEKSKCKTLVQGQTVRGKLVRITGQEIDKLGAFRKVVASHREIFEPRVELQSPKEAWEAPRVMTGDTTAGPM